MPNLLAWILGFAFEALPPEVNSRLLFAGPGPVNLYGASNAYSASYNALSAAAQAADGSMAEMSAVWQSPAADKAQQAFGTHANWLRTQGEVALTTAAMSTLAADANSTARAIMPQESVIYALQAHTAGLVATNGMGQNTTLIVADEIAYVGLWRLASRTMAGYADQAFSAMGSLRPPLPAPAIVAGGGGGVGVEGAADAIATALRNIIAGPHGGGAGASRLSGAGQLATGGAGSGPAAAGTAGSPSGGSSGGGTGGPSGGPTSPVSDTGAPDPTPVPEALGDSGAGSAVDPQIPQDAGLYGAAPTSPTLGGLNGGVGSAVTLSMSRGGIGAMPGAATGFRIPANWNPASAQAFGAGIGNPAAAQPIPQRTAPKGASAPQTLRRRRDQEEERPSKAIAISDAGPVPELEQTTGLGVIEYADADDSPLTASEQLLVPGVLGADAWDEQP
ncbi:PPE family protein [Nocardia tengchongensis]|uniref:PPE family protein n=1 Tax=Nocardia tengchongensis TaxID=2055889 RepID=UPI0036B6B9AB